MADKKFYNGIQADFGISSDTLYVSLLPVINFYARENKTGSLYVCISARWLVLGVEWHFRVGYKKHLNKQSPNKSTVHSRPHRLAQDARKQALPILGVAVGKPSKKEPKVEAWYINFQNINRKNAI